MKHSREELQYLRIVVYYEDSTDLMGHTTNRLEQVIQSDWLDEKLTYPQLPRSRGHTGHRTGDHRNLERQRTQQILHYMLILGASTV